MGKKTEAQKRARNKYIAKTYDQINIRVKKGYKAYIQQVADRHGYTMTGLIQDALYSHIKLLDQCKAQQDLIKVLSLILDQKINKSIDFLAGIEKFLDQPSAEQSQEPQEGQTKSSVDTNHNI